jgi:Smg protein
MFDILMYLFESYFNAGSYPDPDKLSIKLSDAGFEEDDISRAQSGRLSGEY